MFFNAINSIVAYSVQDYKPRLSAGVLLKRGVRGDQLFIRLGGALACVLLLPVSFAVANPSSSVVKVTSSPVRSTSGDATNVQIGSVQGDASQSQGQDSASVAAAPSAASNDTVIDRLSDVLFPKTHKEISDVTPVANVPALPIPKSRSAPAAGESANGFIRSTSGQATNAATLASGGMPDDPTSETRELPSLDNPKQTVAENPLSSTQAAAPLRVTIPNIQELHPDEHVPVEGVAYDNGDVDIKQLAALAPAAQGSDQPSDPVPTHTEETASSSQGAAANAGSGGEASQAPASVSPKPLLEVAPTGNSASVEAAPIKPIEAAPVVPPPLPAPLPAVTELPNVATAPIIASTAPLVPVTQENGVANAVPAPAPEAAIPVLPATPDNVPAPQQGTTPQTTQETAKTATPPAEPTLPAVSQDKSQPSEPFPAEAYRSYQPGSQAAIPAPAPVATVATPTTTAPTKQLSEESKEVLKSVASHVRPAPKRSSQPVDIDHRKIAPALATADDAKSEDGKSTDGKSTDVKTHESAGIKVQIKAPKINLDYELEKAYRASITGQSEAAITAYKNILSIDPKNQTALFGLATVYHRMGLLEQARPLYSKLLGINPNHRDGLSNFMALIADEAPEEALLQLQQLQAANPDFSPIAARMAIIHQKLGHSDAAIQNMRHAIELSPENMAYRYNLAIMLDTQHQYTEAVLLYRYILEAYQRGESVPGNIEKIQQRLTFIQSNKP